MQKETLMNSRQLAQKWPFPKHKDFKQELQRAAATWFKGKNFQTHAKMSYCLSNWSDWGNNLILEEVRQYVQNFKAECKNKGRPFPLHKFVHHGLSSQAMTFNLIGPQITRDDYSSLIELLQSKGVSDTFRIDHAHFEYEDRNVFNEDAGQPTSIDIVLYDNSHNPIIFIESKLVEQKFGGCSVFTSGDCEGRNPIGREDNCYLHSIGRGYWELMAKYAITSTLKDEKQCILLAHYQFFREVLLSLEKGGTFILLCDERSPVFHCKVDGKQKGIMPFLLDFIPFQYQSHVVSITIQELTRLLKNNEKHKDWIGEFEVKYGMK
jgi:hypothetical protein